MPERLNLYNQGCRSTLHACSEHEECPVSSDATCVISLSDTLLGVTPPEVESCRVSECYDGRIKSIRRIISLLCMLPPCRNGARWSPEARPYELSRIAWWERVTKCMRRRPAMLKRDHLSHLRNLSEFDRGLTRGDTFAIEPGAASPNRCGDTNSCNPHAMPRVWSSLRAARQTNEASGTHA